MSAGIGQTALSSVVTALSTELNSLTTGSRTNAGPAIDNTSTNNDPPYEFDIAVLSVTFGVAPTANSTVDLFQLPAPDGTNYASGSSTTPPQNALYVGSFELQAGTGAQVLVLKDLPIPPCKYKYLALNNSGQSFPASGSTVTIYHYGHRSV